MEHGTRNPEPGTLLAPRLTFRTQLRHLRTLRLGEYTPGGGVQPRALDRHIHLGLREVLRQRGDLRLIRRHALDCRPLQLSRSREFLHRSLHIAAMLLANLLELRPLRLGEVQLTKRNPQSARTKRLTSATAARATARTLCERDDTRGE